MTGLLGGAMSALPWLVIAVVLVEFALADELPAPRVRRAFLGAGAVLVAVTATAAWLSPPLATPTHLATACGPLAFLLLHAALRALFRSVKQSEPVLLFTPDAHRGGSRRLFHEPDAPRRVTGWDYVYSLSVGVAMLLSAAPALNEIIARGA
ncbi:MAG: hypothetical protein PVI57_03665 [Gemmatimonadota bacterium]|jgi:hypothetical protein